MGRLGRHDRKWSKKRPVEPPILGDLGGVWNVFEMFFEDVLGLRFCVFLLVDLDIIFIIFVIFLIGGCQYLLIKPK